MVVRGYTFRRYQNAPQDIESFVAMFFGELLFLSYHRLGLTLVHFKYDIRGLLYPRVSSAAHELNEYSLSVWIVVAVALLYAHGYCLNKSSLVYYLRSCLRLQDRAL